MWSNWKRTAWVGRDQVTPGLPLGAGSSDAGRRAQRGSEAPREVSGCPPSPQAVPCCLPGLMMEEPRTFALAAPAEDVKFPTSQVRLARKA